MRHKICNRCSRSLPLTDFYRYGYSCARCKSAMQCLRRKRVRFATANLPDAVIERHQGLFISTEDFNRILRDAGRYRVVPITTDGDPQWVQSHTEAQMERLNINRMVYVEDLQKNTTTARCVART